jgi:hypothetical protein
MRVNEYNRYLTFLFYLYSTNIGKKHNLSKTGIRSEMKICIFLFNEVVAMIGKFLYISFVFQILQENLLDVVGRNPI